MSNEGGPWGREEPEAPAAPRRPPWRLLIWLALMAAIAGGIWLLSRAFPGRLGALDDQGAVLRTATILVILSLGVFRARKVHWGRAAKFVGLWAVVIAVLVVGLTYRDELMGVGQRIRSEFSSSYPVASGPRQLVVTASEGGGFMIMGKVNGQPVRFLVDTGSSDTVLSPADAERLGIDSKGLPFDHLAETANGTGYGARYTARTLEVGPIRVDDMPMVINQAPMSFSLLGMTFLSRLESFQVRGRQLYLTAKP
ncbi:retropepsin-like aspartic protease family protein [Phenylobacterium sp.]|uniref:retropepsin-like aspartic protease family protein n=1 Tax=Phenylobacterium sp. TaxID=1871053 RepID=UPI002BEFE5C6|nr:TIGR02281 family clan AA aspartic protease [Phenylobacterium sp.]HLZ74404.1 TIGR02281 family clan AA aspartic protease [Phenylobacterium sp.]